MLHQTRDQRIELVPFSIPHSNGDEFTVKLRASNPRQPFVPMREINLDGLATQRLYDALAQHQAVMTSGKDGTFITVRVGQDQPSNPESLLAAARALFSQPEIVQKLIEEPTAVAEAVRTTLRIPELRLAIAQLREMLETGVDEESRYQCWFNRHSWVFGADYMDVDSVRSMTARDHVDAFVPRYVNGFREIVELKIPSMAVLRRDEAHLNFYFSSRVSKAIGQVDRYLENFAEYASRGLLDSPEVVAHHPVATIVIGRSDSWAPECHRALHGLNSRLSNIQIITYDYLLSRGERILEIVTPRTDLL